MNITYMLYLAMFRILAGWDAISFLTNAGKKIQEYGGLIFVIIGGVLIIYGVYLIAKGLWQHGKGQAQTNWFVPFAALFMGGALIAGGWQFVYNIAEGGQKTIEDLGNVIIPSVWRFLP